MAEHMADTMFALSTPSRLQILMCLRAGARQGLHPSDRSIGLLARHDIAAFDEIDEAVADADGGGLPRFG